MPRRVLNDSTVVVAFATFIAIFVGPLGSLAAPESALGHAAIAGTSPRADTRVVRVPAEVRIEFNEPLSTDLSGAELLNASSGRAVAAKLRIGSKSMRLTPTDPLTRGAYMVDWRAVSTLDGHPVTGSFGFGVRAPPPTVSDALDQNPLKQNGVARISVRAVFYSAVLVLLGGLLTAALWIPRHREPGESVVRPPESLTGRPTLIAGCVATTAAFALLLLDAGNAGGGLSGSTLTAYGLETESGRARLLAMIGLSFATAAVWRGWRRTAVASALIVVAAVAFSGHANSADPRVVSLATDWLHLVGAAVWIGGMAHMAFYVRLMRRGDVAADDREMLSVVDRFGELAIPAFLLTVVTGLYNTAIELGNIEAFWTTAYGRILAAKIFFVALVVLLSAVHSRLLRPSFEDSNETSERRARYWRTIANEPLLALAVVVLAATLAVFPLPPRQSEGALAAQSACVSCASPEAGEASFADQAGSTLVAVTLRYEGDGFAGKILTLDREGRPVKRTLNLASGRLTGECGAGCREFTTPKRLPTITGSLTDGANLYRFSVPGMWNRGSSLEATDSLRSVQERMQSLKSFRASERISVTATVGSTTQFESQSPDRLRFTGTNGAAGVIIGRKRWTLAGAGAEWAGPIADAEVFSTSDSFAWLDSAMFAWKLAGSGSTRITRLAFMDPADPVWYELEIDRRSGLVLREKMTSPGHFMRTRYFAFDKPMGIRAPR